MPGGAGTGRLVGNAICDRSGRMVEDAEKPGARRERIFHAVDVEALPAFLHRTLFSTSMGRSFQKPDEF